MAADVRAYTPSTFLTFVLPSVSNAVVGADSFRIFYSVITGAVQD